MLIFDQVLFSGDRVYVPESRLLRAEGPAAGGLDRRRIRRVHVITRSWVASTIAIAGQALVAALAIHASEHDPRWLALATAALVLAFVLLLRRRAVLFVETPEIRLWIRCATPDDARELGRLFCERTRP